MCPYMLAHIHVGLVANTVLCILWGLGLWYYHSWSWSLFPVESCWWLCFVMIFVSEPINCWVCLDLHCHALILIDKAPKYPGRGVSSEQEYLSQLWRVRQTLSLGCALQVLWEERMSWPYSLYTWVGHKADSECRRSRHGDTACSGVAWEKWRSVEYRFSNESSLFPLGRPSTQ